MRQKIRIPKMETTYVLDQKKFTHSHYTRPVTVPCMRMKSSIQLQLIKKRVTASLESGYSGSTHKTPDTSVLVRRVAERAQLLKLHLRFSLCWLWKHQINIFENPLSAHVTEWQSLLNW